jgi:hypothetical protein
MGLAGFGGDDDIRAIARGTQRDRETYPARCAGNE